MRLPVGTTPPRKGFKLAPCTGSAHDNPDIDHCMVCAPRWGWMEVQDTDPCRTVILSPYLKGKGPRFTLRIWDDFDLEGKALRPDSAGRWPIRYRLDMKDGKRPPVILFIGDDYHGHEATDSDEKIAGLMGFLTLKPGDTDPDYFKDYTPDQRTYAEDHAESLSWAVTTRFGEI